MKLSNNQVKYLRSLHQRKFRQKYHNFIVEGAKMVEETLNQSRFMIEGVYAEHEWLAANELTLKGISCEVSEVTKEELKKISLLSTPNQVLLVLKQPDWDWDKIQAGNMLSLFLENIQDPGNLGAIIRVADWFGIRHVFLSEGCVEVYNPKVIQSTMGAFLRVQCYEINFFNLLKLLPQYLPIYGAMLDGEDVFNQALSESGLIVIGNESRGISPEVQKALTHQITIPRPRDGRAESLNAAVATGIICAAFKRKR